MTTVQTLSHLKQRFMDTAFVKDAQKGYVVAADFNLTIDPAILQMASQCWAEHYRAIGQVDAVVGLPDAGSRLSALLAEKLHAKQILPAKRTKVVPASWHDVVTYSNHSFTTEMNDVKSHIGFVKPGLRVLLVDDVVAHGETAIAAIKALQAQGVEVVGLAVLFDKVWQKGVARILLETGVTTFSLIRIQHINEQQQMELL